MSREIVIDPEFFRVFGAWLNVDLVDLSDAEAVQGAARACGADLSRKVSDTTTLIAQLSAALEQWDPQIIMQFIEATDMDWLFDERTEQTLKEIITTIIRELDYHHRRSE